MIGNLFLQDEVFWIPGDWEDRSDFVKSVAISNQNKFIFAGHFIMNMRTKETFEVQVFKDADLDNLNFFGPFKNSNIFIRIGLKGSSYKNQNSILEAVNAILKAGGTHVLTEKSGLIYSAESWKIK